MTLCCHNCSLAKVTKVVPVNVWRLLWQNYSYLPSFSISTSGLSWFSHPYLTITQIVGNLLHKFGWLISCLCWGDCSGTHRLWTCPVPCTSGGGRTGTGFCSLCPPRSSSAGDTGNLSHSTETAGRNPGNYLMWNMILIRLIIFPTLHPSHVMTP